MRNSERPEQGAWWAETERCFDGPATFHDCDDVQLMLDGGSDDAGFVQVIQGRISDPEKFRMMMDQPMDMLHQERPEIIGGTIAVDEDGFFTQTIAFRSEAEAREGEKKEMPPEMMEQMGGMDRAMTDVSYHDLHHPWFATSGRALTSARRCDRQHPSVREAHPWIAAGVRSSSTPGPRIGGAPAAPVGQDGRHERRLLAAASGRPGPQRHPGSERAGPGRPDQSGPAQDDQRIVVLTPDGMGVADAEAAESDRASRQGARAAQPGRPRGGAGQGHADRLDDQAAARGGAQRAARRGRPPAPG